MKKILILGALPNENNDRQKLYEDMKKTCDSIGTVIGTPIDTKQSTGSDAERSDRAYGLVKDSDVCVLELSDTSPGALVEFGRASAWDKEMLVIAKEGSMIHPLMTGTKLTQNKIVLYQTRSEIENILNAELKI